MRNRVNFFIDIAQLPRMRRIRRDAFQRKHDRIL